MGEGEEENAYLYSLTLTQQVERRRRGEERSERSQSFEPFGRVRFHRPVVQRSGDGRGDVVLLVK